MEQVTLGKTGICVNKNGFGALPIQRISDEEAGFLFRKGCGNGVNFFCKARGPMGKGKKRGGGRAGCRLCYPLFPGQTRQAFRPYPFLSASFPLRRNNGRPLWISRSAAFPLSCRLLSAVRFPADTHGILPDGHGSRRHSSTSFPAALLFHSRPRPSRPQG